MKRFILTFLFSAIAVLFSCQESFAQFKEKAFTQSYNDKADSIATADSTDKMLNFKEIFGGLAGKRSMRIGTMFGTSLFIPGTSQIYNKQYWKLPIFYGGMVAGATVGSIYHFKFEETGDPAYRTIRNWSFVGMGLFYYASLLDGAICYKSDRNPLAGRATIYSILCPGLGQIYNGEYWKIPIYIGGLVGSAHFYFTNKTNYERFRDIYREASQSGYSGPISADQAKYYRDEYRRYRDYSILAFAAFYLLQIIDANVFCYMRNFEVNEDVVANLGPTVIMPDEHSYAFNPNPMQPAPGMSVSISF